MTTNKFYDEANKVSNKLATISTRVRQTTEVLDRLLNAHEQIEIGAWAVQSGRIFITFTSPIEIEHLPDDEQHIQRTLIALFPTCRISGTSVEIEAGELL